jgi:lysyl-tRNA synthetase class 1
LHFDVIPKAVDEYHQQLRAYEKQDLKSKATNPIFHIHGINAPKSDMVVPFSMLLNLAAVANAEDKEQLWGFIKRYAQDASPENNPQLDQAVSSAISYYNDFVKPEKVYRLPNSIEREALTDLRDMLVDFNGNRDAEELQSIVFSCGREKFDPLRDWFKALYEVLLGASQGPRFGGFIALYGIEETVRLIDNALDGMFVKD